MTNAKEFPIDGGNFEFKFWLNSVIFELKTDIVSAYSSKTFVLFKDIFMLTCKIIRKYMSKAIYYKNACDERALAYLHRDLWPENCVKAVGNNVNVILENEMQKFQISDFMSNSTFYLFNNYCCNGENPSVSTNIETSIVGINYTNEDGALRKEILCSIPDRCSVELICEPDNPYDNMAISVYYGSKKLGYIPSEDAKNVTRKINTGYKHVQSLCVYKYNIANDEFVNGFDSDISEVRVTTRLSIVFFDSENGPFELKII